MRTSARTVSGGSVAKVLHVEPLHQLLVNADFQLLSNCELRFGVERARREAAADVATAV